MSSGHRPAALPSAQTVRLGARGTTSVWDLEPDRGHENTELEPVLLLHGWNVDARLNFESAVPALTASRRVVLFDQHGHGDGVRASTRFDLDHCANDAIAVLDALGIERAVVTGYSLGGAVAQVIARRHPDRCAGLVLAATADRFSESRGERTQFAVLSQGARALRRLPPRPRDAVFARISAVACRQYPSWVFDTVRRADPVALLEAGAALGTFDSTPWAASISTPTAVVVTASDTVVDPRRQRRLAQRIGVDHIVEVEADHDLPIRNDPRFGMALSTATMAVSGSAHSGSVH